MDTLETFIEQLIAEKHAGVVIPEENRREMKADMMAALNKMISVKMLELLSSAELVEFHKLTEAGATDTELQQYVTNHVGPKLTERDVFLAKILGDFRDMYLSPVTK